MPEMFDAGIDEDGAFVVRQQKRQKILRGAFFFMVTALLLFMCRTFFFPVDDPDIFWHLVLGRWIVSHGELPSVEHWNAFGLGMNFRAYSWSNEVIYALIHRHWGFWGLRVFQGALALCLVIVSWMTWHKISRSLVVSLFLTSLFIPVVDPFVGPRPQVFTFVLFSLIPLIAESIRRRGITVTNGLFTALLFCAWANTHLAMIVGMGYLGGLVFAFTRRRLVQTVKILAIAFAGTCITPYGPGIWLTFLAKIGHVSGFRHAIVEFEALSPSHFMFPLWLVAFCLVVMVICLRRKRVFSRGHLFATLVTLSFLALGVYAVKFLAFSAMAALTYLARFAPPILRFLRFTQRRRSFLGQFIQASLVRRFPEALTALCIGWGIVAILSFGTEASFGLSGEDIQHGTYSVAALDYVLQKPLRQPILTDFSNGGYLMYRLSNEAGEVPFPVAIDGRTNILSREESDSYYRMEGVQDGWRDFIDAYTPGTIIWPTTRNNALAKALSNADDWCEALSGNGEGEGYAVFVRCAKGTDDVGAKE